VRDINPDELGIASIVGTNGHLVAQIEQSHIDLNAQVAPLEDAQTHLIDPGESLLDCHAEIHF
jgi:hypothetical protein